MPGPPRTNLAWFCELIGSPSVIFFFWQGFLRLTVLEPTALLRRGFDEASPVSQAVHFARGLRWFGARRDALHARRHTGNRRRRQRRNHDRADDVRCFYGFDDRPRRR